MGLPAKIFLVSPDAEQVEAWVVAFKGFAQVIPILGDIFNTLADAIVSPANSFGIMDGGLDLEIRGRLDGDIEGDIRKAIKDCYCGELPVGYALVVKTKDSHFPYIITAPTMRVPEDVSGTINAYLAFRAVLLAVLSANSHGTIIETVACSGLATGYGKMTPTQSAMQMSLAYQSMIEREAPLDFNKIKSTHKKLQAR